jgi:hypothetical protein
MKKEKTMENKKIWMGMLALALVFGMTVVGCEDGANDGNETIKTDAVTPLITVNPLKGVYLPGATVTPLSVTASVSDGGTLSYQWYSQTTEYSSNPTVVTGATNATFTPPVTTAGTLYYYAEVTNTNNTVNGTKTAVQKSNRAKFVVGWEKTEVSDIELLVVNGTTYLFYPSSIIFANNRFVAVGGYLNAGRQIGWSDDGIKWKVIENTPFGTSVINGIAFGNNRFIAVGEDGKMASSTDGKTWTSMDASSVFGTSDIYDIAYGNNRFFAIGGDLASDKKSGYLADNGSTWTSGDSSFKTIFAYISRIVYDSVNGFTAYDIVNSKSASFGNNSTNWQGYGTIQNSDGTVKITSLKGIISANNYIVAFGFGNDGNVLKYTGTGVSWTNISPSSVLGTNTISNVAYASGKLFAFTSDKGAWSSDNGVTWTEVPYVNGRPAYGAGRFVAIDGSGFSYSTYP